MIPEPGIYLNIPEPEYRALDAVNQSPLKSMGKSAAHYALAVNDPPEQSESMLLGSAAHAALLQPGYFLQQYAVRPASLDGRTKEGKAWAEDNKHKTIITAEQEDAIQGMCDALLKHKAASELLNAQGHNEVSVVWDDASGIRCKARLDMIRNLDGVIVIADLKTTTDASPEEFQRQFYKLKYYVQAAYYLDGYNLAASRLNELTALEFRFVAVEKAPPHGVSVYVVEEDAMEEGRYLYERWLMQVKACRAANEWPAYPDYTQPLGMPAWKKGE